MTNWTHNKVLSESDIERFKVYDLEDYINDVNNFGLEETWSGICQYVKLYGQNTDGVLRLAEFGKLYEIGLETANKQSKKKHGQYYTPEDIATVMAEWLDKVEGENVCDVACGTGNLILSYLNYIGKERACKLLEEGRIYLYDRDFCAMQICKTSILLCYGFEYEERIHDIHCDFLDKNIILPENCKVITNPPYGSFIELPKTWLKTRVQNSTKELYTCFMEKIITQSRSSVHITPYSFICGRKFYSIREAMNDYSGFIVLFDNVPGMIFCGTKHGIFNTNMNNSVRAAVTVVSSEEKEKGFAVSPLIRFKSVERAQLLDATILENFLTNRKQIISKSNPVYEKCFKELIEVFENWKLSSNTTLKNYIERQGKYTISIPNTCRYYTVASNRKLNRNGQILLEVNDEDVFNYLYCLINSSFAYLYWRIYDGGIFYPKKLLLNMPIFYDLLTTEDKIFFSKITKEMINKSQDYLTTKKNFGIQENIKYPIEYRDKINQRLLQILQIDAEVRVFDLIHSNMATRVSLV